MNENGVESISSSKLKRLQSPGVLPPRDEYHDHSFELTNLNIPPTIQHLITKYNFLYQAPNPLPPTKHTNHQIHLNPGMGPINIHPY